jgi:hypothetical protein
MKNFVYFNYQNNDDDDLLQLPKFRLYTGYCHAQADSDRFVRELKKNNKAFANFLDV